MKLDRINKVLRETAEILSESIFFEKGFKPSGGSGRLLVKFGSHRARDKALGALGSGRGSQHKWQGLCSFKRHVGHGVYEVTPQEFEKLKTGNYKFSKFKDGDDLFNCWSAK